MIPVEAGIGQAPQSLANAASDRIRAGLSPATIIISAAESGPIPYASRSDGAAVMVSVSRASSCAPISVDNVSQRVASARSACLIDAVGSMRSPGSRSAQRLISWRSVCSPSKHFAQRPLKN